MMTLRNVDIHDLHMAIEPVDYIHTVMPNPKLIRWIMWVNKNICQQLQTDNVITTGVKLRIATGMLNKLESLTDLEKIQIHSNLIRNVHLEQNAIIDETLPF